MRIHTRINGREMTITIEPHYTLLRLLREQLQLTGTKCGCGNGECGACTIIMNGQAVRSCLVLAPDADGAVIETIEGLAQPGKLHPIQESFIEQGAIQCGFCTPGFIMAIKALLDKYPMPTDEQITESLSGHLCRCTGYKQIIAAVHEAALKLAQHHNHEGNA